MHLTRYAVIAVAMLMAGAAVAQDHPGGGALRDACKADVQQYCANVEHGGGRIMKCLNDNEDKLSQQCKDARAAARARKEHKSSAPPS
jgi:hypothetical protein